MAAEPNIAGMARLLYLAVGVALTGWGLWGAGSGWAQWSWSWLLFAGAILVFGLIGYSPLHFLSKKLQKAR